MSRSFAETNRAIKIAFFVSSLLGLLVGLATGVPEGKALAVRLFSLRVSAIEREFSAFSGAQFQHADAEHARQAVLSEIRTLEALQHLALYSPPTNSRQRLALYIAHARLAMIEEAAGNAPAAGAARAKAAEQWRTLHPGTEATPEQMKQAVRDFDNQAADAHSRR